MKITMDSNKLVSGLETLMRLTKPSLVSIACRERSLKISSASASGACRIKLGLKHGVTDEAQITVNIKVLLSALKGQQEVQLTIDGKTLGIQGKSYEAVLPAFAHRRPGAEDRSSKAVARPGGDCAPHAVAAACRSLKSTLPGRLTLSVRPANNDRDLEDSTIDATVIPEQILAGGGGVVLKHNFMAELFKVLPFLELRQLPDKADGTTLSFRATQKGTFVVCSNYAQSASASMPALCGGDFEFSHPCVRQFKLLARELSGQNFSIVVTQNQMYAWNAIFQVRMVLPRHREEVPMPEPVLTSGTAHNPPRSQRLLIKTAVLRDLLESGQAALDKHSNLEIRVNGSVAALKLNAAGAAFEINTELERPAGRLKFRCDAHFFASIASFCRECVVQLRVDERTVRCQIGPVVLTTSRIPRILKQTLKVATGTL